MLDGFLLGVMVRPGVAADLTSPLVAVGYYMYVWQGTSCSSIAADLGRCSRGTAIARLGPRQTSNRESSREAAASKRGGSTAHADTRFHAPFLGKRRTPDKERIWRPSQESRPPRALGRAARAEAPGRRPARKVCSTRSPAGSTVRVAAGPARAAGLPRTYPGLFVASSAVGLPGVGGGGRPAGAVRTDRAEPRACGSDGVTR